MTEAATVASTSAGTSGARQFQDVFSAVIPFTFSLTEASIASGAASSGDITVPGAALGDFVLVASKSDIADAAIVAQVTAADTVTVTILNNTGGAYTAMSGGFTINGVVLKQGPQFADPDAF